MRMIAVLAISICTMVNAGILSDSIHVFNQPLNLAACMICAAGMTYVLARA